jgi:hypothetical protein
MSCQAKKLQQQLQQAGNIMPYQGQRYRLTYPEKNAIWWSPVPDDCTRERKKECCQRMLYTPTPANQCSSTFMPWDRPDPYQCLKMCKGIDALKTSGCQAQQMKFIPRINDNGCLMEPSIANYTNAPLNKFCVADACRSESILTNSKYNPPNPPQYGYKGSNTYDPILYSYGDSYTY